jgi:hypothetical protein
MAGAEAGTMAGQEAGTTAGVEMVSESLITLIVAIE